MLTEFHPPVRYTHTLDTRTHGAEKSQGAYQRTATVLPLLLCSSRLRRPHPAAAAHLHTTTPISYAAAPPRRHHHAVTTIAVTYIYCLLDRSVECPLLVIQSSQGARGEEFAAEFRSFPASRRLLWGVRSLALPRRSSRAFVRAAVRLYPAGFAQTAPVRSTSWKDPMPPSAYVKAIEELSSPRPAAFFFAVSQAHAGFGRSKL